MKNFFFLFLSLVITTTIFAQGDGIQFTEDSWNNLLKKAKEENKAVFIDAYTTWCGPCKQMAKNIFPLKEVGEVFNKNFVNAKIDMERGEGLKIRKKYKVNAFPTYLFINSDGELIHKGIGSQPANEFIALAEAALNPVTQFSNLEQQYKNGERSPDFLKNYATALRQTGSNQYDEIVQAYLKTQKNWLTRDNMEFIFDFTDNTASPNYDFMIKNKAAFRKTIGEERFDNYISKIIMLSAMRQKSVNLDVVKQQYKAAFPEKADELVSEFNLNYYMYSRAANAKDKFIQQSIDHIKQHKPQDWSLLNSCAWRFYEIVDEDKLLKKAVKWTKKSIRIQSNYMNNDTLAALYYKLGKRKPAMKYANKAIALGKEAEQDTKEMEDLLKKIEIM